MTRARQRHTVLHHGREVDRRAARVADLGADASRAQDLLDGALQALGVLDHDRVELLPLRLVDAAALERLEIQAYGGDRGLQLVGDGVDERVVLFVPPDFAHKEDRVQHHARDDERENQDAEDQQPGFAPVDDDPADVEERARQP